MILSKKLPFFVSVSKTLCIFLYFCGIFMISSSFVCATPKNINSRRLSDHSVVEQNRRCQYSPNKSIDNKSINCLSDGLKRKLKANSYEGRDIRDFKDLPGARDFTFEFERSMRNGHFVKDDSAIRLANLKTSFLPVVERPLFDKKYSYNSKMNKIYGIHSHSHLHSSRHDLVNYDSRPSIILNETVSGRESTIEYKSKKSTFDLNERMGRRNQRRVKRTLVQTRGSQKAISEFPFSCKRRCGDPVYMPCSCSTNCVVYKNCCEGFDLDCPETALEGKRRYAKFLDAEITCTDSDVLVITSCRMNVSLDGNYTNSATATTLSEYFKSMGPIYDKYTDLIFLNQTIFQCNKYPQSEDVDWGMPLVSITDSAIKKNLSKSSFTFNDFSKAILGGSASIIFLPEGDYGYNNCKHLIKPSCEYEVESDTEFRNIRDKCWNLTSYVTCNRITYTNLYCMKCANLFNEAVECEHVFSARHERSGISRALSLLVSLNNDQKMVVEAYSAELSKQTWSTVSCDTDKEDSCQVLECSALFDISSNNTCNYRLNVRLDIHINLQTDITPLHSLSNFLMCKLTNNNFDISIKPTQRYEALDNIGKLVVQFSFSHEMESVNFENENIGEILNKALTTYFAFANTIIQEDILVCACLTVDSRCIPQCPPDYRFYITRSNVSKDHFNVADDVCLLQFYNLMNGSVIEYCANNVIIMGVIMAACMQIGLP